MIDLSLYDSTSMSLTTCSVKPKFYRKKRTP